jgi:hypothetical protein
VRVTLPNAPIWTMSLYKNTPPIKERELKEDFSEPQKDI